METLPPEVTHNIFHKVIEPKGRPTFDGPRLGVDSIPFTLSHVCRSWRNTTLASGMLWSYLSIKCNGIVGEKRREAMLYLYYLSLERTNECPLNFSVAVGAGFQGVSKDKSSEGSERGSSEDESSRGTGGISSKGESSERLEGVSSTSKSPEDESEAFDNTNFVAERIIGSLLSEQYQWQNVNFSWISHAIPKYGDTFDRDIHLDNMPLLRSLQLFSSLADIYGKMHPAVVDVSKSPYLKNLRLEGTYSLRPGPCASIEDCELILPYDCSQELVCKECLNILRLVPSLKKLYLDFRWLHPQDHHPTATDNKRKLVQHNLEALSFTGGIIPHFMRKNLSLLSIKGSRFHDTSGITYETWRMKGQLLLDFIRHFTPSLTLLEINDTADPQLLITTLRLLPTL